MVRMILIMRKGICFYHIKAFRFGIFAYTLE